jgi:hypothetical protein
MVDEEASMAWIDGIGRRVRRYGALVPALALAGACVTAAADAGAAPATQKAKTQTTTRAPVRKARAKPRSAPPAPAKPTPQPEPAVAAEAPREPGPAEAPVTSPDGTNRASQVVKTEADRAGEKTYTFGAQEVEGRLKSPQILYFLRRVRAEFAPAPLGHRSFLLELADTRRHPALE